MLQLDTFLDSTDLRGIHVVLCLSGVLLATHLMQLAWHNPEEGGLVLRWARRTNLAMMALGMLWSLGISSQKGWQPWPAEILIVFSVCVMMLLRIVVIYRMRNRGACVEPPNAGVAKSRIPR